MLTRVKDFLAAICLASAVGTAVADTHYVAVSGTPQFPFTNSATASTNIQLAIDASSAGDNVLVSDGTYYITSPVVVTQAVFVTSLNGFSNTTIDGQQTNRCLYLAHTNACVANFTITHGYLAATTNDFGGAGAYLAAGTLTDCFVTANIAQAPTTTLWFAAGAGVFLSSSGRVYGCTVTGNEARGFGVGGGIAGAGLVENSTIEGNTATLGGGLALATNWSVSQSNAIAPLGGGALGGGQTPGSASGRANGCTIRGNAAVEGFIAMGMGGGVLLVDGCTLENSTITNNSAANTGGGIASIGGAISNCAVAGNTASQSAGGIFCWSGTVDRCTVNGNKSMLAGGVACSAAAIRHSDISANTATGKTASAKGGGLWAEAGSQIETTTFTSNNAVVGGGFFCTNGTFSACRVVGNSATYGAGCYIGLGATVENNLITGNKSSSDGGGVYADHGGTLVNCTISANEATNVGGGLFCLTNVTVRNAILYFNQAPTGANYSATTGLGMAIDHSCTWPEVPGTGNITNDPQFVNIGTNDYHLTPTSPCIDAGTNASSVVDLDGVLRPLDGNADGIAAYDMGAYEFANPLADTDGDGLNDVAELTVYGTNPTLFDTDGDQMPDGWEVAHGLDPKSASGDDGSMGDPDGDGANNLAEYIADTHPRNSDSVLRILQISRAHGGIRIHWKGGIQAWQILECRESMADTNLDWMPILGLPPPTHVTNAVIDMGATNVVLFYRIRAER